MVGALIHFGRRGLLPLAGTHQTFDLVLVQLFLSFFGGGPDLIPGAPEDSNLGGPCQQLLTLLTLKSATVVLDVTLTNFNKNID